MADELTPTEQQKYYAIYRDYLFKAGTKWAKQLPSFEKKRTDPFSKVLHEVNANMRRYLGGERYAKFRDLFEYFALKEGLLVKDDHNNLDIPLATYQLWSGAC